MKIPFVLVSISLALATFSPSARAQTFSTSQKATAASDVFNSGKTALAFDFDDQANSTTTEVNGVTFTGNEDNSLTGVSFTLDNMDGTASNGVDSSKLTSNPGGHYAYILKDVAYNSNATGTLTFSGLTPGDTYELQLWGGSTGANYTDTVTDGSATGTFYIGTYYVPSGAGFIDETFTAPHSGHETLALSDTNYIALDAINLQEIPEPSIYAMIGVGALVLTWRLRRKLA